MSSISPSSGKRLRIFAGPNGSGKSTLFESFSRRYSPGVFVNADELENKLRSSGYVSLNQFGLQADAEEMDQFKSTASSGSLLLKSAADLSEKPSISLKENCLVVKPAAVNSYHAAWAAAFIRWLLLRRGKSFAMETVMSHHSKIDEINEANRLGYKTYLYYVCTSDPLINSGRIAARVDKGGHPVPTEKIANRYSASLGLLAEAVSITYRAYLFDNSGRKLDLIAEAFLGRMKIIQSDMPKWFLRVFSKA
jgi:predicted ABC-type ATPase